MTKQSVIPQKNGLPRYARNDSIFLFFACCIPSVVPAAIHLPFRQGEQIGRKKQTYAAILDIGHSFCFGLFVSPNI